MSGKIEAAVFDGALYPFPCLLYGGVGQSHHLEGGKPAGNIRFDRDGNPLQAEKGIAQHFCNHIFPPRKTNSARGKPSRKSPSNSKIAV